MKPAWKKLAGPLMLVTSVLVSLLLVEVGWRLYLFGTDAFSPRMMKSVQPIAFTGILQASRYPGIIYELAPNLDTYHQLVPFRTNADGMRDDEYPYAKPPGTVRVAVIGDSFAMGSGVEHENIFPTLLEESFGGEAGQPPVEFLNFGVGGYSLRDYLSVMRHRAPLYETDVLLIAFCGDNDYVHVPETHADRPYNPPPDPPGVRSYVLEFLERVRTPYSRAINERQIGYVHDRFADIRALSDSLEIPVVLVYVTNIPNEPDVIRAAAEANGLPWIDASEGFTPDELPDYSIRYPVDTHPNEAANRRFADAIYPQLLDFFTQTQRYPQN